VSRTVVLLHGLWMPGVAMHWLAGKLQAAGFKTEVFAYLSVADGPDRAVPRLIETIGDREVDIVAHSLGGLIALQALADAPQLKVRRVVCLGSPLAGSGAAAGILHWPMAAVLLGRSAGLLREGFKACPAQAEIGVVAGRVPHGLGALFAGFGGDHDGTVAVEETRLSGVKDHVVVDASHSGLLFSAEAAGHAVAFLRSGAFAHG
jgi:pimeloyl-ACP methyl ester carboxylesterase